MWSPSSHPLVRQSVCPSIHHLSIFARIPVTFSSYNHPLQSPVLHRQDLYFPCSAIIYFFISDNPEETRGCLRKAYDLFCGSAEEGPQTEQSGGSSPEEEAGRHVWEALMEDSSEHQRHHPPGSGSLCPWLFCLNSVWATGAFIKQR